MVRVMKQCISDSYTRAGTMKRCGESIVLEINGGLNYLMKSDFTLLSSGQSAGLVTQTGEEEGCAWLSPVRETKKIDLVSNLHGRIYIVSWREVQRIINKQIHLAKIFEYSLKEKSSLPVSFKVLQK
jgi:hypothetical protein